MTWNINQRSGLRDKTPDSNFVEKEIKKSDIAIITEFKRPQEKLKEFESILDEYWLCYSPATQYNEILIAVKKGLTSEPIIEAHDNSVDTMPNFLQVYATISGKQIRIIGTRIRIRNDSRIDYIERKQQLHNLIWELNKVGNQRLLIGGDFNNLKLHGDQYKTYCEVREEYKGKDSYDTYNYHILKDSLLTAGFKLHTPEGRQYSWGFNLNGETDEWDDGYLKNDHFVSNGDIKLSEVKYDKKFINPNNGYVQPNVKTTKNSKGYWETKICPPYPDHAILTAELEFCDLHPGC